MRCSHTKGAQMTPEGQFSSREEYEAWKNSKVKYDATGTAPASDKSLRTAWNHLPGWAQGMALLLVLGVGGFVVKQGGMTESVAPVLTQRKQSMAPNAQPVSQIPTGRLFEIVAVDSRVTESNNVWWRYAWKLTLKNGSAGPQMLQATIEFQDKEGFIIDSDHEYNLVLQPDETRTFTGTKLVTASSAGNVAQTAAKVRLK
jgi:hypothetical protein